MKAGKSILQVLGTIFILIVFLTGIFSGKPEQPLAEKLAAPLPMPEIPPVVLNDSSYWGNNSGHVSSADDKQMLTVPQFELALKKHIGQNDDLMLLWTTPNKSVAASAMGTDSKQHFVQGFLSQYKPFETEHLWVPLKTIAMRKQYMYDHKQYNGLRDVWQYSVEAYQNVHGDCEDHSILLCDWLNTLGYDARVVLGMHGTEGHAWVVLYSEGKEFILEATQKENLPNNTHYPLATLMPKYLPTYMFDHDYFYVPKVQGQRTHRKTDWVKSSKYLRNSNSVS